MPEDKTAFVITSSAPAADLPLDVIMEHYARFRDAIAGTPHIDTEALPVILANASFVYAFNVFKAISLLLPHLYFEAAASVVRQLWEVSLNLHWVMADADHRASTFCGYTMMEYRKILKRQNGNAILAKFDEATKRFRDQYSFTDRKGKERQYANYSNSSVQQRAEQLGEPWRADYLIVYDLTSMHAHGAPGAILQAIFRRFYSNPDIRERDASALMATVAIKTMMRNVELLASRGIIIDATGARREYDAFLQTLDAHASKITKPQQPPSP